MPESLAYYVMLLKKSFTGYCSERLQELGLSQGLLYFILYIGKHPGCSPSSLAGGLQMDNGHVNRCLAKLIHGGFISQEINPDDRRGRILRLREKGTEAFRISHDLFTRWDNEIMQEMPEADRKYLLSLLQGLAAARK